MIEPDLPLPVTSFHSTHFSQKPIAVLLALAALATIALYAVRSLRGRIQPQSPARLLYNEALAEHKAQDAIDKFTLALNSNPDPVLTVLIHSARAKSYRALQQLEKALEDINVVLACEFLMPELRVNAHIFKGEIYAQQEDHDQAVLEYDTAFNLKAGNGPLILYKRGCSKIALEDFQSAVDDFTAANDLNPDPDFQCKVLASRASAFIGLNRLTKALDDCKKARPKDVNLRKDIHVIMGSIYDAQDKPLEAAKEYKHALGCNPSLDERVNLLRKRAASNFAAKQPDAAIADLGEAWDCNPPDPYVRAEIRFQRGKIYHQLKKFEKAIEEFTFGMTLVPPKSAVRAEFLLHRGLAQENNKEAALKDWEEGLQCDLESGFVKASLLYLISEVEDERKENEKVIKNVTAALKCKFDHKGLERDLYRLRARAHRRANHLKEAIEDWDMTLTFEFDYPDEKASLFFARGMAHQKNNEMDKARHDYQEALKIVINEDLRQQYQAKLDSINVSSSPSVSSAIGWVLSSITGSPFSTPNK